MRTHWIEDLLPYTGEALSNHWIYKNFGILGDAVVAFVGPCDVTLERMVDLEDVLHSSHIYSSQMLHFIVEIFNADLREGVLIQRLFSAIVQHRLNDRLGEHRIERRGDDLFFDGTQKLSVSICTLSPTSILIHAGLNIDAAGAPVEAAGLSSHLGFEAEDVAQLAQGAMRSLVDEWKDIRLACCKVRAVF
jgi:hypothetical protein